MLHVALTNHVKYANFVDMDLTYYNIKFISSIQPDNPFTLTLKSQALIDM